MRLHILTQLMTLLIVILGPIDTGNVAAQSIHNDPPPYRTIAYALDSGVHDGDAAQSGERIAFQQVIRIDGATWLRIHFAAYQLGQASYVTLTSLQDQGVQRFDATSLQDWSNTSAFFNGNAVELALHVAAGDHGVFVRVDQVLVGQPTTAPVSVDRSAKPNDLCGADDRIASSDGREGRLSTLNTGPAAFCTAWLVSNGALLTAGHCADFDPDGSGPMLPDGALDWTNNTIVEFNVPGSTISGTINYASPNNQYPVNLGSVTWRFDGEGQGLGKDWTVFGVNPNSNTHLRPHQVQGFFRMTYQIPAGSSPIRVTGYGVDTTPAGATGGENAQTRTNQTSTGPYDTDHISGADVWHTYAVDTTGGNSGSPIIWENNGFTIGIHTNGGCTATGGNNAGTGFGVLALQQAIQHFPGPDRWYVDKVSISPFHTGFVMEPFQTIAAAISAAGSGHTVSVVAGHYNEPMTINKNVILEAPVGTVVIGAP
jgi:V8-like Glu-specific endopeptidase